MVKCTCSICDTSWNFFILFVDGENKWILPRTCGCDSTFLDYVYCAFVHVFSYVCVCIYWRIFTSVAACGGCYNGQTTCAFIHYVFMYYIFWIKCRRVYDPVDPMENRFSCSCVCVFMYLFFMFICGYLYGYNVCIPICYYDVMCFYELGLCKRWCGWGRVVYYSTW